MMDKYLNRPPPSKEGAETDPLLINPEDLSTAPFAHDKVLSQLHELSDSHALDGVTTKLNLLNEWLRNDLLDLEKSLKMIVRRPAPDLAWSAAQHLLGQSGKRIRPICVLLAARLGGRGLDHQIREVAVCAEMIHTATLLHDDVIDEGDLRRGIPSSRMLYGNSASVLGGNYLLIDALMRIEDIHPRILRNLLAVVKEMVAAEVLQFSCKRTFNADREMYLRIAKGKTAALFRWSLESGAILGGLDDAQVQTLGEVGNTLGLTFQMIDDVLDLEGHCAETGKSCFIDIEEGKLTWPTILAAERDPDLAHRLELAASEDNDVDLARLLADVQSLGAIEDTRQAAREFALSAGRSLDLLPEGKARDALHAIVAAALRRSF